MKGLLQMHNSLWSLYSQSLWSKKKVLCGSHICLWGNWSVCWIPMQFDLVLQYSCKASVSFFENQFSDIYLKHRWTSTHIFHISWMI